MKVNELMQRRIATVHTNHHVADAARLMHERDCGCVVVLGDGEQPLGILTDRDISLAALRAGQSLDTIPIASAMSRTLFSCTVDDTIETAERTMALHQVRRLPVIDRDGRMRGLIALDDIAREACRDIDLFAPPVSCAAVGRTLGEIVRPRLIQNGG